MKEEIKKEDQAEFQKLGKSYAIMLLLMIISLIPLFKFLSYIGIAIWVVIAAITFYVALLVEKKKKEFNIQSYREIVAFSEGKPLDELAKAREEAKRPYQKVLLVLGAASITIVILFVIDCLFF